MYSSNNRPGGHGTNGTYEITPMRPTEHSPARLERWNAQEEPLPERTAIKAIHIYDFDNTLFKSPLPNAKIWHTSTLGHLMNKDYFKNGGWWHDSRILAATGKGLELEEPRNWEGWWNKQVVSLVELSMQQKDALTVLLTGRSVAGFIPLIKRMVASKKLKFDIIALKPEKGPDGENIKNTLYFKCMFMNDLLNTYIHADEVKVYEDREKHVRAFESFLKDYIRVNCRDGIPRIGLASDVIHIAEESTLLDPVTEVREALKMVEDHNQIVAAGAARLAINKTVSYTGYLLAPATTARLLSTLNIPGLARNHKDIRLNGTGILISPRPVDNRILINAGPLGTTIDFQVTGWGHFENKVWAACVQPVDANYKVFSGGFFVTPVLRMSVSDPLKVMDGHRPLIILAIRRDGKPSDAQKIIAWQPVPAGNFVIRTMIAEMGYLRVDEEAYHPEVEKPSIHQPRRGNFQGRHNSYNQFNSNRGRGGRGRGRGYGPNSTARRGGANPEHRQEARTIDRNSGYSAYERHQQGTRPVEPQDMQFLSEMYE
ncbi:hypothetical protein L873DRAFT_1789927 [Choiromyces venosus 120613-1]|uniref:Swiss Army Knife RNA repair protein HAD domain-containing protein n=1 Tax=Choiromyces venosus 120613-1 TaxID=1336337 RepID=A0A3N4JNG8_9PEZI|nr:hypothetical protein L873DRAFT_1789927 [Choiromyces venosus 120613-1]